MSQETITDCLHTYPATVIRGVDGVLGLSKEVFNLTSLADIIGSDDIEV
jgi:hypothetical protein